MKDLVNRAPIPRFRDLFCSIRLHSGVESIIGNWRVSEKNGFLFSKTSVSFQYIYIAYLRHHGLEQAAVWIPGYFCNESLHPLRMSGAKLVFYPIREDLHPDIEVCEQLAENFNVDIFICPHYFGKIQSLEAVSRFCANHSACLIEDAAHVLHYSNRLGQYSDFVVYSPHKNMPMPDGSVLTWKKSDDINHLLSSLQHTLDDGYINNHDFIYSLISCLKWLLKRIVQRLGYSRYSSKIIPSHSPLANTNIQLPTKMGLLSMILLKHYSSQLSMVKLIRRRNYIEWKSLMRLCEQDYEITVIENGIDPFVFVFHARTELLTKKLYHLLRKVGLPVFSWPDIPIEVANEPDPHYTALNLREKLIFLPLNHTMKASDIKACSSVIREQISSAWSVVDLDVVEWDKFFCKCPISNLLQSSRYGEAKRSSGYDNTIRYLIMDSNNKPVAIAQILVKRVTSLFTIALLNRGPLILSGIPRDKHELISLLAIHAIKVRIKALGYQTFLIRPEIQDTSTEAVNALRSMGLIRIGTAQYGSGLVDLTRDESSILAGFASKWRNSLRKGQRLGVYVEKKELTPEVVSDFLESYKSFKKSLRFSGISDSLLLSLVVQKGHSWTIDLLRAYMPNSTIESSATIGYLLCIKAGLTSTYLIGTTSAEGRCNQANTVLLWESIRLSKANGSVYFDIGGLNNTTPAGVASFKKGMNSSRYTLLGLWGGWL